MSAELDWRKADCADIAAIVALVNSAYRGDSSRQGWTTEADILDGQRTDQQEVLELIERPGSMLLVALQGGELVGSVHLKREDAETAYLGMLTIRPGLQGIGLGNRFIWVAEEVAVREWGVRRMTMSVITLREELIAYYERRGYRRTGELLPFPESPRFGLPRVGRLQLELLEKPLAETLADLPA